MNFLDLVPREPTWDIIDSSKLTEFLLCPRKYFYRYILGWTPTTPNNHLIFGSAWHLAVEHLLRGGTTLEAYGLFEQYYRQHFAPSTDELFEPKTPANALRALEIYAPLSERDLRNNDVLHTEVGGLVSVDLDTHMAFKLDAVLRTHDTGTVWVMDHKTSQSHRYNWADHWSLSTQMLLYLHALKCFYPSQSAELVVRTTFFCDQNPYTPTGRTKKTPPRPHWVEETTINKSNEQMEAFLSRTQSWNHALKREMDILLTLDSTDSTSQHSFPQRESACFAYGRTCPFFDYCLSWSNPLTRCESPPLGYEIAYWNPLAAPEIREKVTL